jgi:hypothetical protein
MKHLLVSLAILPLAAIAALAANPVSLGYSDDVTVVDTGGSDACAQGTLYVNHDGSFENGYAWQYGGSVAPYYGAFGEGYNLGAGGVCCGAFWVSTLPGYFFGQSADVYVWAGGAGSGAPGSVLGMVPGNVFPNVPNWPTCAENDVMMQVNVSGEFTVGFWGNWPGALCGYFTAADLDGFGGHPWTNIAPGIGYPTGWNDPSIVWGATQSMGIGAYFATDCWIIPSPAESETWGSIKTLFR